MSFGTRTFTVTFTGCHTAPMDTEPPCYRFATQTDKRTGRQTHTHTHKDTRASKLRYKLPPECMACNPAVICVCSRTGLACGRRALAVSVSTARSRRRCARNKAGRAEVYQAPGTRSGVDPGPISLSLLCFRRSIAFPSDCKAVVYSSKFSHRVVTYSTPYPPWVECCVQPTQQ